MLRSLLLPAFSRRLSPRHMPRNPYCIGEIRFFSMRENGGRFEDEKRERGVEPEHYAFVEKVRTNAEKSSDLKPMVAISTRCESETIQSESSVSSSLSMSELEMLFKESSTSKPDPRLRAKVIASLNVLASSPRSFENHQSTIKLLHLLARNGFYFFTFPAMKRFIESALRDFMQQSRSVPDQTILELLGACVQAGMLYQNLPPTEQSIVRELIGGIRHEFIVKDFSTYCEYFYVLGKVFVPWKILPIEKRKDLLSCLKRFGEVKDGEERARGRLIYGVEKLLILKQSVEDMDEGVRECYERLLMRELEGRYSERGRTEMRGADERMPIAYAILCQLRLLLKLRGIERLSERQLDLIYKGLEEEWQMREMNSFDQALVILGLGEMGVNYRSLPTHLWSMMMDDVRKKMQSKIKPVSLSSLCKGWKGMRYKCKDMEEELKEAVLRAVVDLCRDERNVRGIANVMLYLGDMEVNWEKDMKEEERKDLLEGIVKASMRFHSQGLSNTLLGLSYMKASWKGMSREEQNSLLVAIEAKCKEMNEQNISNTLYSLGQLGLTWKDVSRSLKENLIDCLHRLLASETFIIINLNGSVNGLNTMGYDWKRDEKLSDSILRVIEGYYANEAKINKMNRECLPALVYSLGEGKVQWEKLRAESKQALVNGMEAYCKGEDMNAKKVSTLIYGLANMRATIYNIPTLLKELLEGAVRKIARKNFDPPAVASIMNSFSGMQYSWEMIGEETREALQHMIRQSSRAFNAQGVSNTCYSVAVMTRDYRGEWEKSYFLPLQECFLRRNYEIETKSKGKRGKFWNETRGQLSVYLSWLDTLPPSMLSFLLQSLQQDKLPDIEDPRNSRPSPTHKQFSDSLRGVWRDMIEKEVREGKMSEKKKERMMKVKMVDEYFGLSRKVFPMDIAVVEEVVGLGGEKKEKVWLFIEIDGVYRQHTMSSKEMKDGSVKPALDTRVQLKEYLYGEKFKGVPIRRYSIKRIQNQSERLVNEIVKKLWEKVSR